MDGTTVVVTGASRGLGRAVAHLLGAEGAHVFACARTVEDLDEVAAAIREDGGAATTLRADVRDEFDVERFVEVAAREGPGGGIDLVVPAAGVYHGSPGDTPLTDEAYSAWDDTLRTNARGVFTVVKEAVPHLEPDARVLVPSGGVAREARPGFGAYAVSKAAAEAVAHGFAADLDVTVGVLDVGTLSTALTEHIEAGRDPEAVAPMVRWAATEADPDALDGSVTTLDDWEQATD